MELLIPAGSQPNDRLKLKGRGVPRINSMARGDQFVNLKISIPRKLTDRQKELLEEFEGIRKEETPEEEEQQSSFLAGVVSRIKKAVGGE